MNMFGPNNQRPSCGNAAESLAGDVYNLAGQIDPSYYNLANGIRVICGDSGTEPTDSNADSTGPLHRMCEESANNFPECMAIAIPFPHKGVIRPAVSPHIIKKSSINFKCKHRKSK